MRHRFANGYGKSISSEAQIDENGLKWTDKGLKKNLNNYKTINYPFIFNTLNIVYIPLVLSKMKTV